MNFSDKHYKPESTVYFATGLFCLLLLLFSHCSSTGSEPREVWISNIIAKPEDFRNVNVKIIGIVQDIEVDPKGTRQGYYQLNKEGG